MHCIIRIASVILIFNLLSSQDLVERYKRYLPGEVVYNTSNRNMINGQLKAKAKIHPDLIYFHIERTKLQFSQPDNALRMRRLMIFEEIEKKYIRRRSDWASSQINLLKKSQYNADIKTACFAVLEKLLIDTKERANALQENELTVDLTEQAYFKYLYYLKESAAFDSSLNYDLACKRFEQDKYQTFALLYKHMRQTSGTLSEDEISDLLRNWYIFEERSDGPEAFEILAVNYANQMEKIPFYRYGISLGYNLNNRFDVIHDIKIPGLTDPAKIYETSKTNQVVLGIHRYIPLNEAWVHFCYLNLELSAAFSASNYGTSFSAGYNNQKQIADTLYTEYLDFTTNKILIKKRNSYAFRISTPVYAVSKVFFINLGLGVALNSIAYDLNYQYKSLNRKSYFYDGFSGRELRTISSVSDSSGVILQSITDMAVTYLVSLDVRYQFANSLFLNFGINQEFLEIKIGYNIY